MRVLLLLIFLLNSLFSLGQRMLCGPDPFDISLPIQNPELYKDKGKIKEIRKYYSEKNKSQSLIRKNKKGDIILNWFGKDSSICEYEYDKLGQKTSTSRNYFTIESKEYDKKNRLITKTNISNGHFWAFPDSSKPQWHEGHKEIESLQYHSKYEYTKYVISLKEVADTFLVYEVKLNKNLDPVRIRKINTEWRKTFIRISEIKYNKAGLISELFYYPENEPENYWTKKNYAYNARKQLVAINEHSQQVDTDTSLFDRYKLTEYQYLSDGSLSVLDREYGNNTSTRLTTRFYNKYGNMEQKYFMSYSKYQNDYTGLNALEERFKYKYDIKGNWIEMRYKDQIYNRNIITRRKITYYD